MNFSKILLALLCLILSSVSTPVWSTTSTVSIVEGRTPPVKPAEEKKEKQTRKFCLFCGNNEPPAKWRSSIGLLTGLGTFLTIPGLPLFFGMLVTLLLLPFSTGYLWALLVGLAMAVGGILILYAQHSRWKQLKQSHSELADVKVKAGMLVLGILLMLLAFAGIGLFMASRLGIFLYLGVGIVVLALSFVAFQFMFSAEK